MPIYFILGLAAAAIMLARRGHGSSAAAGARWDYWDPARWARDRTLHLEQRRRLIWNPERNAWYRAEEMGYGQPQPAQTWVPSTGLVYGGLYRFAGVRPAGMSTSDLRAALSNLGWNIRSFWRATSPNLPPDYPVQGRPAALDDPQNGYVVEAYWYAPTTEMQQGIEAPVRYHGAAVTGFLRRGSEVGYFLPDHEMGYVPPPPRLPPRGGYRPPPRRFRPPPPRAFRPPPVDRWPHQHWRRPWQPDYVPQPQYVPQYIPQPQYVPQPEYVPVPVPQQQYVPVPIPQQQYVPVPTDGGGVAEQLPPDQGGAPQDQGAPDQGAPDQGDQGQGQPPNGGDAGGANVSGWGQGYGPWQHGGAAWGYGHGGWGWPWGGYPPYVYGYPVGYDPYGYATGLNLLNLAKDVALAPLELAEAPFKATAHVVEHVEQDIFGQGQQGGPAYGYAQPGQFRDDRWRRDQWHREHMMHPGAPGSPPQPGSWRAAHPGMGAPPPLPYDPRRGTPPQPGSWRAAHPGMGAPPPLPYDPRRGT